MMLRCLLESCKIGTCGGPRRNRFDDPELGERISVRHGSTPIRLVYLTGSGRVEDNRVVGGAGRGRGICLHPIQHHVRPPDLRAVLDDVSVDDVVDVAVQLHTTTPPIEATYARQSGCTSSRTSDADPTGMETQLILLGADHRLLVTEERQMTTPSTPRACEPSRPAHGGPR